MRVIPVVLVAGLLSLGESAARADNCQQIVSAYEFSLPSVNNVDDARYVADALRKAQQYRPQAAACASSSPQLRARFDKTAAVHDAIMTLVELRQQVDQLHSAFPTVASAGDVTALEAKGKELLRRIDAFGGAHPEMAAQARPYDFNTETLEKWSQEASAVAARRTTMGSARDDLQPRMSDHTRDFIERCYADYAAFHKQWAPIEQRTHAQLQQLEPLSYWQSIRKLMALYEGLSVEAKRLGIQEHVDEDGIGFEAALMVYAKQREVGDGVERWQHDTWELAAPATGDDFYDRNHFCAARAFNHHWEEGAGAVWLKPEARTRWLAQDRRVRIEPFKAALALSENTPRGKWESSDGRVDAVSRAGKKMTMSIGLYENAMVCKRTNRIARIDANGFVTWTGHYNPALKSFNLSNAK
jgi:hypothetical protein